MRGVSGDKSLPKREIEGEVPPAREVLPEKEVPPELKAARLSALDEL